MTPEELVEFAEALSRAAANGAGAARIGELTVSATGGRVVVRDGSAHIVAADPSAPIKLAAHLAGEALAAVRPIREAGGTRAEYWSRLLSGEFAGNAHPGAAGVSPASHYIVVALEPEPDADARAFRTFLYGTFHGDDASIDIVEQGPHVIAAVPAGREVDAANARTAASLLPKSASKRHAPSFAGGFSGVKHVSDVVAAVREATTALSIVKRLFGTGTVRGYDELGAYPLLLAGGTGADFSRLSQTVLEPLRAYDRKHQTELEQTLRVYFQCGQNVKAAAAELFVHRHTVFYRLRQIGEISARSLDDAHDQLTLRLAIAADALHAV